MKDRLQALVEVGVNQKKAQEILEKEPPEGWRSFTQDYSDLPFESHFKAYQIVYANWDRKKKGPPIAWLPDENTVENSHLKKWLERLQLPDYKAFHRWTVENRTEFWKQSIEALQIKFETPYETVLDCSQGLHAPKWLPGAKLNIADSCFQAEENRPAILYQKENSSEIESLSYGELNRLSNRIANSLVSAGFSIGDAIAIDMPMTKEAVAIYLGIVKAGMVAVSIADSFAPSEIETRLKIANAKGIFTQDYLLRLGKKLPLYEKVQQANAHKAIVLPCEEKLGLSLRKGDTSWEDFLVSSEDFQSVAKDPDAPTNILFSSGTTGDPKAIPWTHLTPIKSAIDGYFHHDIQQKDVVAWPTNLGWMMGPWLIYASLLNRATMALYYGAPTGRAFGEFVSQSKISMLGLVPSVVKAWRQSDCMKGLDWSAIKCFSSTGECSNEEDYLFLMSLAKYRPVIEYCGGTEIGGGYITGTLIQPAATATFTTPAVGLDLVILDEEGKPTHNGELFLIPPSIGLSNTLLNRDHFRVYYDGTPKIAKFELLRRHGDQMESLANGFYRGEGRADDTMNLGGIKTSSAEIERVMNRIDGVVETAAIAKAPTGGGPSLLILYAVLSKTDLDSEQLRNQMQQLMKTQLNPLFKIHEVVPINSLPRTASNKVMRRVLRDQYVA